MIIAVVAVVAAWTMVLTRAVVVARTRTWSTHRSLSLTTQLAIASGVSFVVLGEQVGALVGPGASLFWSQVCTQVAAVAGSAFLVTLTRTDPDVRVLRVVAVAWCVVLAGAFLALPETAQRSADVMGHPDAWLYAQVHSIPMAASQLVIAGAALRVSSHRPGRRSRRVGMLLVVVGGLLGAAGHVVGSLRQVLIHGGGEPTWLRTFGLDMGGLAIIAYCAAGVVVLLTPVAARAVGDVLTARRLVVLRDALRSSGHRPTAADEGRSWELSYRAELVTSEVLDGLRRTPVTTADEDPVTDVVDAVLVGGHPGGRAATVVLPLGRSAAEDRAVLVDLADRVREGLPEAPKPCGQRKKGL